MVPSDDEILERKLREAETDTSSVRCDNTGINFPLLGSFHDPFVPVVDSRKELEAFLQSPFGVLLSSF